MGCPHLHAYLAPGGQCGLTVVPLPGCLGRNRQRGPSPGILEPTVTAHRGIQAAHKGPRPCGLPPRQDFWPAQASSGSLPCHLPESSLQQGTPFLQRVLCQKQRLPGPVAPLRAFWGGRHGRLSSVPWDASPGQAPSGGPQGATQLPGEAQGLELLQMMERAGGGVCLLGPREQDLVGLPRPWLGRWCLRDLSWGRRQGCASLLGPLG